MKQVQVSVASVQTSDLASIVPDPQDLLRWDVLEPENSHDTSVIIKATSINSSDPVSYIEKNPGLHWRHWLPLYPVAGEVAFRYESAVESCSASAASPPLDQELWRCYLVYFDIKPEFVGDFKELLLTECRTVFEVERGMRRYDLLQAQDNPCHFMVYEIAEDEVAMEVHEARRSDGSMRRILAGWEATSRKTIDGTGRYWIREPTDPRKIGWAVDWRYS